MPETATRLVSDIDSAVVANVDNPAIVDPAGAMSHFYARLEEVVRGTSSRPLRIAVYGDSNMTMDYISGSLRRLFQQKFGDGGHGYLAFAQPWPWYQHQDVKHRTSSSGWIHYATSDHPTWDYHYGISHICCESDAVGAWSSVGTVSGAPVGERVSSFDVYYIKRPKGGRFAVDIDDVRIKEVETRDTSEVATYETFDVPEGPHALKVTVTGGHVRLLGATLERGSSGIVVDTFGVGGLNYGQYDRVSAATREPMLKRRSYDLVVFLLGTNVYTTDERTEADVAHVVDLYRASLPETSVLLLSPPDADDSDDPTVRRLGWSRRMRKNTNALRHAAEASHTAFWDLWSSMGGSGSMRKFHRAGLADDDLIHFRKKGGALMGLRLAQALLAGLRTFADHPPDAAAMR